MAQKRPDRPTQLKQRGMTPSLCEPSPMLGIMGISGYESWQLSLIVSDTCMQVRGFFHFTFPLKFTHDGTPAAFIPKDQNGSSNDF